MLLAGRLSEIDRKESCWRLGRGEKKERTLTL